MDGTQSGHVAFSDALRVSVAGTEVVAQSSLEQIAVGDGLAGRDISTPVWVLPGLVNSHDHLEFNTFRRLSDGPYSDYLHWGTDIHQRYAAEIDCVLRVDPRLRAEVGVLKNLLSGVTTIIDHGADVWRQRTLHLPRDCLFVHAADAAPYALWRCWRRRRVLVHIGEGVSDHSRRSARRFLSGNWRGHQVIGIHGVSLRGEDFGKLAGLVWCPVANQALLGQHADAAGAAGHTTVLFGSDASITAPGDFWSHLRFARGLAQLGDDQLLGCVTTTARRFWDIADDSLVVIRRHEENWHGIFATSPADVLLVVRGGRVLLADAGLPVRPVDGPYQLQVEVGGRVKYLASNISGLRRKLALAGVDLDDCLNAAMTPLI